MKLTVRNLFGSLAPALHGLRAGASLWVIYSHNWALFAAQFFLCALIVGTIFIGAIMSRAMGIDEPHGPHSHNVTLNCRHESTELRQMNLALLEDISVRSPSPEVQMLFSFLHVSHVFRGNSDIVGKNCILRRQE